MFFSIIAALSASLVVVSAQEPEIPVPWEITGLTIENTRHGTGGFWQFNITDTPTFSPQGFNTQTCYYYGATTYDFAIEDYPVDAPCNPSFTELTFTLAPAGSSFIFNITHAWGPAHNGLDNGTWSFSYDDVRGQEFDVLNNFGQAGAYSNPGFNMYPLRSTPSLKCEFC